MLTSAQGELVLKLAKQALVKEIMLPNKGFLLEKKGVFVTLTLNKKLRGCIGFPFPVKNLGEAVIEASKSAAFNDPRFEPLTSEEIKQVEVEVSILSKPFKCKLEDIKKGDGVILEKEGRSALFLPQVWEDLPYKTTFLIQLSIKAGLMPDDYKTASYKKFSVQVFK